MGDQRDALDARTKLEKDKLSEQLWVLKRREAALLANVERAEEEERASEKRVQELTEQLEKARNSTSNPRKEQQAQVLKKLIYVMEERLEREKRLRDELAKQRERN